MPAQPKFVGKFGKHMLFGACRRFGTAVHDAAPVGKRWAAGSVFTQGWLNRRPCGDAAVRVAGSDRIFHHVPLCVRWSHVAFRSDRHLLQRVLGCLNLCDRQIQDMRRVPVLGTRSRTSLLSGISLSKLAPCTGSGNVDNPRSYMWDSKTFPSRFCSKNDSRGCITMG